ncbi:MAG: hypothetical protein OEZ51_15130 [Nitrospinota bacterium]|nr:hypothetical protein [Nitrospinota bacterium]
MSKIKQIQGGNSIRQKQNHAWGIKNTGMERGQKWHPAINIGRPIGHHTPVVSLTEKIPERVGNEMKIAVEDYFIFKQ